MWPGSLVVVAKAVECGMTAAYYSRSLCVGGFWRVETVPDQTVSSQVTAPEKRKRDRFLTATLLKR